MAKGLNNIPGFEQFIDEKSDTTNLGKKWATWKDDFNLSTYNHIQSVRKNYA